MCRQNKFNINALNNSQLNANMLNMKQYILCTILVTILPIICGDLIDKIVKSSVREGLSIQIDASKTSAINKNITYYNEVILPSNSITNISIKNLQSQPIGFAIIQVHSYLYNVTLSYNRTIIKHFHENGTNLGFILYPDNNSINVYIHNRNHLANINASIVLIAYDKSAPIPGGCNLEYSVREAPILQLKSQSEFIIVDTPLGGIYDDGQMLCNLTALNYRGYHYYLQPQDFSCRSYFNGIKALLTIQYTTDNGLLATSWPGITNRRSYVALPGTGMVFTTLIYNSKGNVAAYVPAFTISCHPLYWDSGCKIYNTPGYHVLAVGLIFIGIIKANFNFACGPFGAFIDGFIIGAYITFYILYALSDLNDMSMNVELVYLTIGGLLLAITFVISSILIPICAPICHIPGNIIVGYLLSALCLYTIDDVRLQSQGYFYDILSLGFILLVMILLPPCYSLSGIIISAIWGAAAIIQGYLMIAGKNTAIILINPIRLMAIKNYRLSHITPNLIGKDYWYLFFWFALTIAGVCFQLRMTNSSTSHNNRWPEEEPLISRWTGGSDSVFETPRSNQQFISRYRRQRNQRWRN